MDVADIGGLPRLLGVTLVELLVTIALMAIVLSWGTPSFISLYQRNTLITEANRFVTDLMRARSEAIKRNRPTVMCRSEDGSSCLSSFRARAEWSIGWIIFENTNRDKIRNSAEPLIRVGEKLAPPLTLYFNRWWRLSFQPTGRASNGTFTLCGPSGDSRTITVYRSGRFRLTDPEAAGEPNPCPPS